MSKQDVINKAVKSNEPPVWLLFSAGGSVSAFFFPVVILIFALLLPFGIVDTQTIIAFAHTWIGKLAILVLTIFPMWAGMHRVHHGLHDLKVHLPAGGVIFYGLSAVYTVVVAFLTLSL